MTTQEKKYLKYGGIALGIGAVLWLIFKPNNESGSIDDPTGNGEVLNPNQPGGFNAAKVANDLYEAVKDIGFASVISGNGDEKEIIYNILKNVSASTFTKVVTAFGQRYYNPTFGGTYFAFFSTPEKHTLPFILKKELTTSDYNILKQKYPNSL